MANARRGLGRGLDALLGEPVLQPSEPINNETPETAVPEKSRAEKIKDSQKAAAEKRASENKSKAESGSEHEPVLDNQQVKAENGSDSVIPDASSMDPVVIEKIVEKDITKVPISQIEPNPDQPRTKFKKEELEELADSISRNGLLQPILVRDLGDRYQIIAGERRWKACQIAGLEEVPINKMDAEDDKVIELAMIENIQRTDLNPIEEAYGYRRLMERRNLTQSQLAQIVSKGRSTIANSLRLLDLPEDAQQLLFEEKITAGHARAILSIPTAEGRQKLTDKLVEGKMSVREAENYARLLSGRAKSDQPSTRPSVPKEYKAVAKNLSKALDTKVKVKVTKDKNKLEIEFADQEQLEQIFARFIEDE